MATLAAHEPAAAIDPETQVGVVALTVANLDRSIKFYTEALGMAVMRQSGAEVVLGAAETPILLLTEQPGALPWMVDAATGLYHFAVLLPTRVDLGHWLRRYISLGYPPPGQGDHIVSEALYLRDCDGHGIEMYRDRPRDGWRWNSGSVQMGTGPVDIRGMMSEADRDSEPWTGLRAGTHLGHMHLQVGDIPQAEAFYHGVLGFDVVAKMPSALFVSAGGYHHHLGMNTWHSQGADPAPDDTARLRFYSVDLPSEEARGAVLERLSSAGIEHRKTGNVVAVDDPWHNHIVLQVGSAANAEVASGLASAV
jgi:catechol 2,3-dioxygenase